MKQRVLWHILYALTAVCFFAPTVLTGGGWIWFLLSPLLVFGLRRQTRNAQNPKYGIACIALAAALWLSAFPMWHTLLPPLYIYGEHGLSPGAFLHIQYVTAVYVLPLLFIGLHTCLPKYSARFSRFYICLLLFAIPTLISMISS